MDRLCPEWREYTAGGGAAIVSITVTYPFNKAIYRQQIHDITAREAFKQMRVEGRVHLFRGIVSPLIMKLLGQSIMFGTYSQYSRVVYEHTHWPWLTCKLVAASMAGATEGLFAPLERVQVLMQEQSYHADFRNSFHAFTSLHRHGLTEYYRGVTAILLRNTFGTSSFFLSREFIQAHKDDSLCHTVREALQMSLKAYDVVFHFMTGAVLGAVISSACFPINVIKANMQYKIGGPFQSLWRVSRNLVASRGVLGMFRGVHINFSRSFVGWGLVNLTYEHLLQRLRRL